MPTPQEIDEALFDDAVRHRIFVNRFASQIANELTAELREEDENLLADIEKRLDRLQRGLVTNDRDQDRQAEIFILIAGLLLATYRRFATETADRLRDFSEFESALVRRRIGQAFDALVTKAIDPALLRPVVSKFSYQGKTLREWFRDLERSKLRRIRDEVRIGLVAGETTDQIMTRLKGTRAFRFRDGVLSAEERKLRAVVQTTVTHVSARAREITFAQDERIRGVRWISVLDSRTTPICRSLSNRVFKLHEGPRPPVHVGCRSTISPVILMSEPASEPPYEDWLRRQPIEMQDEILGKKKGVLFRKGQLPLTKFVDRRGRELTLKQLREKEEQAWMRAFPKSN